MMKGLTQMLAIASGLAKIEGRTIEKQTSTARILPTCLEQHEHHQMSSRKGRSMSLDQHQDDLHMIKSKLEQEKLEHHQVLAELNLRLQQVTRNVDQLRQKLDFASRIRAFCLNANNFYNKLEALEKLERGFRTKNSKTPPTYGCTNQEKTEEEKAKEQLHQFELELYRKSCVQARECQEQKNDVWLRLEASMQQRESLKPEILTRNKMLRLLCRATKDESRRREERDETSESNQKVAHHETTTTTSVPSFHARQLSCEDREQWERDVDGAKKEGTEDDVLVDHFFAIDQIDTTSTLQTLTRDELNQLSHLYRDVPEWSKLITLCKLKIDIDARISSSIRASTTHEIILDTFE